MQKINQILSGLVFNQQIKSQRDIIKLMNLERHLF